MLRRRLLNSDTLEHRRLTMVTPVIIHLQYLRMCIWAGSTPTIDRLTESGVGEPPPDTAIPRMIEGTLPRKVGHQKVSA